MDFDLICNVKKCRKRMISGRAWTTVCSHIFCSTCSEEYLLKKMHCPACNHPLKEKLDFARIDLNPPDKFKSMVLLGLRPDVVMDICTRAMNFWTYQNHQEHLFKEHMLVKAKEKSNEMEKYCNQLVTNWKIESKSLQAENSKEKERYGTIKKRLSEVSEQLREKNKMYQRLQANYNNVKRTSSKLVKRQFNDSSPLSHNSTINSNDGSYSAFNVPSPFVLPCMDNKKSLFSSKPTYSTSPPNHLNFGIGNDESNEGLFSTTTENLHSEFRR